MNLANPFHRPDLPRLIDHDDILEQYSKVIDSDAWRVTPSVLANRLRSRGRAPPNLDFIPPDLVASVDCSKYINCVPAFLLDPLSILVEDPSVILDRRPLLPQGYDPVFSYAASAADAAATLARRSVPNPELSASKQRVIQQLLRDSTFYEPLTEDLLRLERDRLYPIFSIDQHAHPSFVNIGKWSAHAGVFLVPKTEDTSRVISDWRAANHLLRSHRQRLEFISIEFLRATFGKLRARARELGLYKIHTVSADLRHWFHALRLPRRYKLLGKLLLERALVSRALPMGWSPAPLAANAATWAMLLHTDDCHAGDRVPDGLNIDVPALNALVGSDWSVADMPPYVPLLCGGLVTVFLDNILVLTLDGRTAELWQTHIITRGRMASHDGAQRLKETDFYKKRGCADNDPNRFAHLQTLMSSSDETLTFLGILWSFNGTRPLLSEKERQQPIAFETRDSGICATRGAIYSALGKILWWIRSTGQRLCSPRHAAALDLYRKYAPAPDRSWKETVQVDPDDRQLLDALWAARAAPEQYVYPRISPIRRTFSAASDASGEHQALGIVELSDGQTIADPQLPWRNLEPQLVEILRAEAQKQHDDNIMIHLLELSGAAQALRILSRRHSNLWGASTLVVLGTDSMTARGWIARQYARNAAANRILELMAQWLGDAQLHVAYVPSHHMVADAPSRGLPLDQEAARLTRERLERQAASASFQRAAQTTRCEVTNDTTQSGSRRHRGD